MRAAAIESANLQSTVKLSPCSPEVCQEADHLAGITLPEPLPTVRLSSLILPDWREGESLEAKSLNERRDAAVIGCPYSLLHVVASQAIAPILVSDAHHARLARAYRARRLRGGLPPLYAEGVQPRGHLVGSEWTAGSGVAAAHRLQDQTCRACKRHGALSRSVANVLQIHGSVNVRFHYSTVHYFKHNDLLKDVHHCATCDSACYNSTF